MPFVLVRGLIPEPPLAGAGGILRVHLLRTVLERIVHTTMKTTLEVIGACLFGLLFLAAAIALHHLTH